MNLLLHRTTAVLMLLGLAACVTSPSPETIRRHKGLLRDADRALKSDLDERAIEFARQVEDETMDPALRRQAAVLIIEAYLRRNDDEEVERRIRILRDEIGEDPTVDELEGKLRLKQGAFELAAGFFEGARDGYEPPEDRARATDLLLVARGLAAWSDGRILDAEQYWNEIDDLSLRDEMNRTLDDVVNGTKGQL